MRVNQRAQNQDSKTEAAKWNSAVIHFIIYTCAFYYCDISKCHLKAYSGCLISSESEHNNKNMSEYLRTSLQLRRCLFHLFRRSGRHSHFNSFPVGHFVGHCFHLGSYQLVIKKLLYSARIGLFSYAVRVSEGLWKDADWKFVILWCRVESRATISPTNLPPLRPHHINTNIMYNNIIYPEIGPPSLFFYKLIFYNRKDFFLFYFQHCTVVLTSGCEGTWENKVLTY